MELKTMFNRLLKLALPFCLLLCGNAMASQTSSAWVSCTSCTTISSFKNAADTNFKNQYQKNEDQTFYYTVVNANTSEAVFIKVFHYYEYDAEMQIYVDYTSVTSQTSSDELHSDFLLSKEIYTATGEIKEVEITIDASIEDARYVGVMVYNSKISQALQSHATLSSGWHKLARRTVLKVNLNDGKFSAFFQGINTTNMYIYLPGTAVNDAGELVSISTNGATVNSGSTDSSGGVGDIGIHDGRNGTALWNLQGGVMACVYIDGMIKGCYWVVIP